MVDTPEWKKVLRERNAIAWIGFFVLVIAIGIGTLYFGGNGHDPAKPATTVSHAAR
jgi:hypothetical protein